MRKLPTEAEQAPATPAPCTAVQAVRRRMRQHLQRSVCVLLTVCVGIAVLLRVLDGGRIQYKLIYSLCIGSACMLIYYAAYLAMAWLHDRLRTSRSLGPDPGPFARGWGGVALATATSVVLGPPLGQWVADAITGFNTPGVFDFTSSNARITMLIDRRAHV